MTRMTFLEDDDETGNDRMFDKRQFDDLKEQKATREQKERDERSIKEYEESIERARIEREENNERVRMEREESNKREIRASKRDWVAIIIAVISLIVAVISLIK